MHDFEVQALRSAADPHKTSTRDTGDWLPPSRHAGVGKAVQLLRRNIVSALRMLGSPESALPCFVLPAPTAVFSSGLAAVFRSPLASLAGREGGALPSSVYGQRND